MHRFVSAAGRPLGRVAGQQPLAALVARPVVVPAARQPTLVRFGSKQKKLEKKRQAAKEARQQLETQKKSQDRQAQKRTEGQRVRFLRQEQKLAQISPLCHDIPTIMRYVRAAEVGRPASAATVQLQIRIIAERGLAPVNTSVTLPRPLGGRDRIAVFTASKESAAAALKAGAAAAGGDDLIAKARDGDFDFDRVYATPDIMGKVNALGKILGPKGLMPTKKRGTVTDDIAAAIAQAASEKSFKQHDDFIKVAVGNPSFSDLEIARNVQAVLAAVRDHFRRSNPDGNKLMAVGKTIVTSPRSPPLILAL